MTNVSVRRSPFMERGNDPLIGLKIKLDRPIDRDRHGIRVQPIVPKPALKDDLNDEIPL